MVQYVSTPWRDAAELFRVKKAFFPRADDDDDDDDDDDESIVTKEETQDMKDAVDRVAMWMARGNCPHIVESTALLTAAIVEDGREGGSEYAARAAYSTAFSRFVTGLLDGQQDKVHKMSMFTLAKNIGLPATFVELRHQAIHEGLPSLVRLRKGAKKGLRWIWEYYWAHVADIEEEAEEEEKGRDTDMVDREEVSEEITPQVLMFLGSLEAADGERRKQVAEEWVRRWGGWTVEVAIGKVEAEAEDRRVVLRAMQVMRELEEVRTRWPEEFKVKIKVAEMEVGDDDKEEEEEEEEEDDDGDGWRVWEGKWKGKPIGVV